MSKYVGKIVTNQAPAGYSVFFDGTGDFLTAGSNTAYNIDSGSTDSFICEGWFYWNVVQANTSLIDNGGLTGVSFPNWYIILNARGDNWLLVYQCCPHSRHMVSHCISKNKC